MLLGRATRPTITSELENIEPEAFREHSGSSCLISRKLEPKVGSAADFRNARVLAHC
jgi:hypothetical protein